MVTAVDTTVKMTKTANTSPAMAPPLACDLKGKGDPAENTIIIIASARATHSQTLYLEIR